MYCFFPVDTGYIVPVVIIDLSSRAEEVYDKASINRADEDKAAQVLDGLKETISCLHLKPVQQLVARLFYILLQLPFDDFLL